MRAFLRKFRLNIILEKFKDSPFLFRILEDQCFPDELNRRFHRILYVLHRTTSRESFIQFPLFDFL